MEPPKAGLAIRLLGVPEVWFNGRAVPIHRRLVRALLYCIAAHRDGIDRDKVAALLAPQEPQRSARRRLTRLLWHLRTDLGPEGAPYIRADAERLYLAPGCWVDLHVFLAATEQIHRWRDPVHVEKAQLKAVAEALNLYRGEFLSGLALPHHPEFEGWVLLRKEWLAQKYLEALAFLAHAFAFQGDFPQAIAYARRGLEIEPIREDLHRLLMQIYAGIGQRTAALRQYERCVVALEQELGVDPLPETQALYQAILRGAPPQIALPRPVLPSRSPFAEEEVPFVGREAHLQMLETRWQAVTQGAGHVVFVQGEPGIGKTRLVHEFLERVEAPALVGASEPGGGPYHALHVALAKVLPSIPWEHLEIPAEVLAEVGRLLPEVRAYCPDLPLPLPSDPEIGQVRMFEALFRFLQGFLTRPTVMFFDDVHWADESLIRWLGFLSRRLRELPALLVIAYRSEEASPALRHLVTEVRHRGTGTVIELTGLTEEEVQTLVRHLHGADAPRLGVEARQLRAHTGGNPYFLLETVRWLVEREADTEALPIPDRVRDVLGYRIGLLSPLSRQVLNAAAILHPYLTVPLLARTAGRPEAETAEALDDLLRRRLLVQVDDPRFAYRFAHEQLRQVTYELMGVARRRHLHRRAAQALQTARPASLPDLDAILARHWEAAGEIQQALDATLAALERSAQQFAYSHVLALADKALAFTSFLPQASASLATQARVLLWRGRAHRALRRYAAAREDLTQATQLAESLANPPLVVEALYEAVHIAVDRKEIPEAEALAERCVRWARRCGDARYLARALYLKEMVAVHFHRPASAAALTEALHAFEEGKDRVGMAEVWNLRGVQAMMEGNYDQALEAFDQALLLAQRTHHYFLMHRIQANRGHVLYNQGDFAAAWEAFARAEEWLRNVGVERPDELLEVGKGYAALHLGRSGEAERAFERALSLSRQMDSMAGQACAWLQLALVRNLQGRPDEAAALLQRVLAQEQAIDPGTHILALETWGHLLRQKGEVREALRVHREAVRRAHRLGNPRREAAALCELGRDLLCAGRAEAARRLFQKALAMAASRGEKGTVASALTGLAAASPADAQASQRALEAARATGSLLLTAEAVHVAAMGHIARGDPASARRLVEEIRPALQRAGWTGLLAALLRTLDDPEAGSPGLS